MILFAIACGAFFTATIALFGARFVGEMFKTGQQSNDLEAPMWIVYLAIPLGSGLMCLPLPAGGMVVSTGPASCRTTMKRRSKGSRSMRRALHPAAASAAEVAQPQGEPAGADPDPGADTDPGGLPRRKGRHPRAAAGGARGARSSRC